ncbi:MAG TPA: glycosyltransferase [Candidatus Acidoferrales bacterium]|nr:glycosyltransferase [Candidatus Acidoferrales bacterium]
MRFHILGLPHTISSRTYAACAFTQKIVRLCKMMRDRGHYVIHYGHEASEVECDEHVTVIHEPEIVSCYGVRDWRVAGPPTTFNNGDAVHVAFNARAAAAICDRKEPNDFLLCMWGSGHQQCATQHSDMIVVEPGIGYGGGYFAPYRVWESYAIMHAYFGLQGIKTASNARWYDVVIPNYFDLNDFEFREQKSDYFLFLGRLNEGKGLHIAVQICEEIGAKLIVAGPGNFQVETRKGGPVEDVAEYFGVADYDQRRELLAGAKGVICPSTFIEPFNGVHVEAMLSGTPVITSDMGAFAEYNLHGVTGYRCRTFNQFVQAARHIGQISPIRCREWAQGMFDMNRVALKYEDYFQSLLDIRTGDGWYTLR